MVANAEWRNQTYRIKPYKHPRLKFVVRSKISGRWERKFFVTKGEAQTYVSLKEAELPNQGREGATFSSALRHLAKSIALAAYVLCRFVCTQRTPVVVGSGHTQT
jgi:hypothetical protein